MDNRGTAIHRSQALFSYNTKKWATTAPLISLFHDVGERESSSKRKAFRMSVTLHPMYPPRISTAQVRAVIRELSKGEQMPSGALVRATLAARFGSRGGVARIYRLLAEERQRLTPPPDPNSIVLLRQETDAMRERAERAESREESHQMHWAAEIDRLRMKVADLEPLAQQARILRERNEVLRQQLQSAEQRASRLEQQLIDSEREQP